MLFALKKSAKRIPHRINARVVLGVTLIVVASLASWGVYRLNANTATVLVANRLLVEGEQVSQTDFRSQEVASGAFSSEYFLTGDPVVGKVVTRVVHPGELIPRASIGEASETLQTTLVIDLSSAIASSLHEGDIVDVWAADSPRSSAATATTTAPHAVVRRARLAHKQESGNSLSSGDRVEIVLPRSAVPEVLQSVAQGDAMTVVASSGGLNS